MKVRVLPRLQEETWSLYWKESLHTTTQCLPALDLELACDTATPTAGDLLTATAAALNWPPASSLLRLEGFTGPWERVLLRGRELAPGQPLQGGVEAAAAEAGRGSDSGDDARAGTALTYTVVRVTLKADGWKIRQADDFLTDSDDE